MKCTLKVLALAGIVATLLFASCAGGPKAHNFSKGPLVDDLADFSRTVDYSKVELRIDAANAGVMGGDDTRVCRTADTEAFLLYSIKGAKAATVETWFWSAEDITDFEILVGKDRYSLVAVTPERKHTPATGMMWHNVRYTVTGFPAGSTLMKIVFKHKSAQNYWNPQVGRVRME